MLKTCLLTQNNVINKTCGEIICFSETSFHIVCSSLDCGIKLFEYDDFIEHFRTKHWPDVSSNDGDGVAAASPQSNIILKSEELSSSDVDNEACDDKNADIDSDFNPSEEEEELLTILKKKKEKNKQFECTTCCRKFTSKSYLQTHIRQKHSSKDFPCDKCEKCFPDARYLKLHQRVHEGYICKTCGIRFENYDRLRHHRESHIDTRNFICDYENCGKSFPTHRKLNAHKRIHCAKWICEECGLVCRYRQALIVHKRLHTGEKPFSCELCDKSFGSNPLLKEHMAAHEPERKHVCDVCGKSFNRPKALYHHKHLHLEIKKFVCKICGQAYAQAAGLSAHMRKHRTVSSVNTTFDSDMPSTFYP